MTHEALVEKVAIAISGAPFPSKQSKTKAKAAIDTIRVAISEPTEGMRSAAYTFQDDLALRDGDVPIFDDYWRIGLAASALGEQSK